MSELYNSQWTGAQIDAAIGDVRSNKEYWNSKSGKAVSFTVTLAAASWSSKAQTVSNANILTGAYAYVVSPAPASFGAYSEAIIYADNVTQAGKMTFHCSQTPTAALTVNITRIEVGT